MGSPHRVEIRKATRKDIPQILGFIRELAIYEKLEHEMKATPEILEASLFPVDGTPVAHVVMATLQGQDVGFALFFYNFSTWTGKKGLYLEDLYVQEAYRRQGIGKALLTYLAKWAVEQDCGRFEWSALDWNTPAIQFYKSLGAITMDGWTVFRLHGPALLNVANETV